MSTLKSLWLLSMLLRLSQFLLPLYLSVKATRPQSKRKDKMAIFQCLMTHRATGWAHQDTVNALNTIDIIFVDDESVRKCWADLFSKYKPNYSTQEITTAQCKLLEAMAETLGYKKKITWETIQTPISQTDSFSAWRKLPNLSRASWRWLSS